MKLLRVSVAGLMGIVLVAAVGFAALRNPTIIWASALFTLLVMMLCSATLGAIAVRGSARLMWVGFAIFGSVYLSIAFGIGSESHGVTPPPFLTQALCDSMKDRPASVWMVVTDSPPYGERFLEPPTISGTLNGSGPSRIAGTRAKPTITITRINWINLRRVVHTLGAMSFALLGALVARVIAVCNEEGGEPRPSSERP